MRKVKILIASMTVIITLATSVAFKSEPPTSFTKGAWSGHCNDEEDLVEGTCFNNTSGDICTVSAGPAYEKGTACGVSLRKM